MSTDIEEYEFKSFESSALREGICEDFEMPDLEDSFIKDKKRHESKILFERESANKSQFKISPVVKKHRGMNDQLVEERKKQVADEVNKKVAEIQGEAYRDGFEQGARQGREEVFKQTRLGTEEKLTALTEMISNVLETKGEIIATQQKELYSLVRTLCKWVILREIKEEESYLERLLEKLILEIQTKNNLLVKVDQKSFESMEDILESVQNKLGELTNVRVEIDYDSEGPGIILESENGIINGTLKQQFSGLDRLFESVGMIDSVDNDFQPLEELDEPFEDGSLIEAGPEVIETDDQDEDDGTSDGTE